ncbi:MAG: sugar phosphate isomerase/epimerase [bacterium]|nr:sugar phosphate isomerase/epimerase [bacterium]
MFVAASTECFPKRSMKESLSALRDLEYTAVELIVSDDHDLKPADILADLAHAVAVCQDTYRLDIAAFDVRLKPDDPKKFEHFAACCKLAKAIKVVTLTVPSGEQGTPFNEEVETLREFVKLADAQGVRVATKTEVGRLASDVDTIKVMCDHVEGLGVMLDPSHFICRPDGPKNYDRLIPYVYHVRLRDTKPDQFQIRVGQGDIDYGKLVDQLNAVGYNRALTVDIPPMAEVDHAVELRKMRMLLESLL